MKPTPSNRENIIQILFIEIILTMTIYVNLTLNFLYICVQSYFNNMDSLIVL